MAELVLRQVEPAIIEKLKVRADKHSRSVEDEHREILRQALAVGDQDASTMTFEEYLRKMPDVGTDTDFSRIEGPFRDVRLAESSRGSRACASISRTGFSPFPAMWLKNGVV